MLCMFASYFYCQSYYRLPILPAEGLVGTARITIDSVSDQSSHFGPSWLLKGTIQSFIPEGTSKSIAHGVPYRLTIPANGKRMRPPAHQSYSVKAKLRMPHSRFYTLSVDKKADWLPIQGSWSLAESRYDFKKAIGDSIRRHVLNTRAANLLVGLVTGEFSDKQTRLSLGRFGLQHILAISGFHFAILAAMLSMALGIVLPLRWQLVTLLAVLAGYCLFLGYGPSIMRAWIAISVALVGQLLTRQPKALNSMGVAMLVIIIIDPLAVQSPAFQLSFLATSAILLLTPPVHTLLTHLWPPRSLSNIVDMSRLDQHGYVILGLCRHSLALTLAVHIATVPVCLWYFEKFPLLSLLYNLFFPFLVSVSMLLLMIGGVLCLFIPALGDLVHSINGSYTHLILNMTFNAPAWMDFTWRIEQPPLALVIGFVTLVTLVGILARQWLAERNEMQAEYTFL